MSGHLLYVAWGFPPCRGSGVYRALATPNLFAEAGSFPCAGLEPEQVTAALEAAAEQVRHPDLERWRAAAAWAPRVSRSAQLAPRLAALTAGVGGWVPSSSRSTPACRPGSSPTTSHW